MTRELAHRGPDASGCFVERRVALGHTRLAVIDLSSESNQPFFSDDQRYVLVYNGEIFNYIELREELLQAGLHFRTQSDTEVVLKAYEHWGPAATHRFNGMWAFAIYDRKEERLFCSRDRYGIKPFNYFWKNDTFGFASEVKSLLVLDPSLRKPNPAALSLLLRKSISGSNPETCFEEVRRLPPAHNLTVTEGGIEIRSYWQYPSEIDTSVSMEEAAEKLEFLLSESVRLRLRSDVPVGITLSSGMDSSSIACLARRHSAGRIVAFTANYEQANEEADTAESLATSLSMPCERVPVGNFDYLDTLRSAIRHLESPHASPAIIPYWHIMAAVRRSATVVLEGQGSDELLGGYTINVFPWLFKDLLSQGHWRTAYREFRAMERNCAQHKYLGRAVFLGWLVRSMFPSLHGIFRQFRGDESVYTSRLTGRGVPHSRTETRHVGLDAVNRHLVESHSTVLRDLLFYGDAISMAHSVESRVPFMDFQLIEYCFRLPGQFKMADGYGKEVLRRAMEEVVPRHIVRNRFKLGFVSPIDVWFRENPEQTVYPVLDSPECRQRGYFDHKQLMRMVQRHVRGEIDISNLIFRWLSTEIWFQEFIDRPYRPPAVGFTTLPSGAIPSASTSN